MSEKDTPSSNSLYDESKIVLKELQQSEKKYAQLLCDSAKAGELRAMDALFKLHAKKSSYCSHSKLGNIFQMCGQSIREATHGNADALYTIAQYYKIRDKSNYCIVCNENKYWQFVGYAANQGNLEALRLMIPRCRRTDPIAAYCYYKFLILKQNPDDHACLASFINFLKYDAKNATLLVNDWLLNSKLAKQVREQQDEIANLKTKLEHLTFAPGGPGYRDALKDYETQSKKRKRK